MCGQIKDRISRSDKFIYPVKCGNKCQYQYQYDLMVFYFPEIICNLYITCMTGLGILKCKWIGFTRKIRSEVRTFRHATRIGLKVRLRLSKQRDSETNTRPDTGLHCKFGCVLVSRYVLRSFICCITISQIKACRPMYYVIIRSELAAEVKEQNETL